MRDDEIKAIFDQQANSYDERWAKTAPIRDGLHFLLEAVFADLPEDARMLCVGVGTGDEMRHLAQRFPRWSFIAVEPSSAMLDVCRTKAEAAGFAARCQFHEGYLDTLPASAAFDGATCFLVSQFILDRDARIAFFRGIAERLRSGGVLASSDLAAEAAPVERETLLAMWLRVIGGTGIAPEALEQMRAAYARDVAILPPAEVASLITSAGFAEAVRFYQSGMIHAWFSSRS